MLRAAVPRLPTARIEVPDRGFDSSGRDGGRPGPEARRTRARRRLRDVQPSQRHLNRRKMMNGGGAARHAGFCHAHRARLFAHVGTDVLACAGPDLRS